MPKLPAPSLSRVGEAKAAVASLDAHDDGPGIPFDARCIWVDPNPVV